MSHRYCVLMQKMAIVFERAYVCIVGFIKKPVYILTYIKSMYECVDWVLFKELYNTPIL